MLLQGWKTSNSALDYIFVFVWRPIVTFCCCVQKSECYIFLFGFWWGALALELVIRKCKKIKILLQIGFHHIIECPMCTTTLLLTMYYYLELLKYLTWSVSVSTQQQNVYKTTRKFPCTNMQAFLKWWLSFQYRTTPIFFSFRVCFQKRCKIWDSIFCPFLNVMKSFYWLTHQTEIK